MRTFYRAGVELLDKNKRPIEHVEYEESENLEELQEIYDLWEISSIHAKYLMEVKHEEHILKCDGYKGAEL